MKGVILGICPEAQIVDISHGVTPFEIGEGAYLIAQAWRYFPKKTVHVVVVDPGVGTARRPILVEAGGQYFLGPDNGVLSMVYLHEKCKVRHVSNEKYFRHPVSQTFHGRDIFAPVGAHLAAGASPASVGKVDAGLSEARVREAAQGGEAYVDRADSEDRPLREYHYEFPCEGFRGSGDAEFYAGAGAAGGYGSGEELFGGRGGGVVFDFGELGVLRGFVARGERGADGEVRAGGGD